MTITEPAPPVTTRPDVDLLDPEFHVGDPHPAYTWMRANEPIYRDRNGIWCMTRMEHVRHVERHASDFVSSRGYRSTWFPDETSMICKDDPEPQQQRQLLSDLLTPRPAPRLAAHTPPPVGSAPPRTHARRRPH